MASSRRKIAIVGAGQAGLQLGCGLLDKGYEVVLVQDRTADEIAAGGVMSSQCLFGAALQDERELGLDFWGETAPALGAIDFTVAAQDGSGAKAIAWSGPLDQPARSVDQRLKFPAWMKEFERRGGKLVIRDVCAVDMDCRARDFDLVIVAAGRSAISKLFERDPARSPFAKPQRALALAYVRGMTPRPGGPAISFNVIPGVGEYVAFPALTLGGPCEIMMFEGVIGGPLDCWKDVRTPAEHLATMKALLEAHAPWEAARCRGVELTDDKATLSGAFAPIVRKPIGRLPTGKAVLGMADAVCLNDPITRQGANDASKAAKIYLGAIVAHGERTFDEAFMQATFDAYWAEAQYATSWTIAMLRPPAPQVIELLAAAQTDPDLARRLANGFDDPRDLFPWFVAPDEAEKHAKQLAA
jgi:hypothetical protein